MRYVSEEFLRVLSSRLKLGDRDKPVYRVEVDRMAFIPGYVEEMQYFYTFTEEQRKVMRSYINPSGNGQTTVNGQTLVFPAMGYSLDNSISSPYGSRGSGFHKGIDIGCKVGTPIVAAAHGIVSVVSLKDKYTSWGYYIDIKHVPGGAVTRYAHLSEVHVLQGQFVQAGQVIASSGNTGNVRQGGYPVGGSYDDPDSPRSRGDGAHLHFEVLFNGKQVDPYPFLKGDKYITASVINVGDVTNEGEINLIPGDVIFEEIFVDNGWLNKPQYGACDAEIRRIARVDNSLSAQTNTGNLVANFADSAVTQTYFSIDLNLSSPALLEISFCSDITDGEFGVWAGDKQVVKMTTFNGLSKFQTLSGVFIPSGNTNIKFLIKCNSGQPKKFVIDYFKFYSTTEDRTEHPGYWYEQELYNPVLHLLKEKKQISVGNFVYMDTIVLDNVTCIDRDNQFESDCAEARVTIANPNGIYSPDFSPWRFPEVGNFDARFCYEINGMFIGVLSENAPVRIYEGYGLNDIRVFTGLIDKVDINAQDESLTFSCRDMYKRVLEKVLTENKYYPNDLGDEHMLDTAPPDIVDPVTGTPAYKDMDRYSQIVYCAQKYAAHYDVDAVLILAIAKHETQYGTLGAGTVESGGYICGYGRGQKQYAGIEMQCKMVAKRIREALNGRPITQENIDYLNRGGDLGPGYPYCVDSPGFPASGWVTGVWNAYNEIKGSSPQQLYTGTAAGMDNTYAEMQAKLKLGSTMWLKSAIVHDLAAHAKMFGWRAAADDLAYPDAVIEETYLIEVNQATGKVIRAGSNEGEFFVEDIAAIPTIHGWMNPFCEYGRKFEAFQIKVGEAIREVIKDTNLRSYCDRFGTYRLERIRYNTPVVAQFTEYDDLVSISKTVDWSRGRSHVAVIGSYDGGVEHFIDKEILAELKGEVRTAVVLSPWAKTRKQKEEIALRLFWDMKRLCRTLQVGIPGRPDLDVLDRVYIADKTTGTREVYCVKGIRANNSAENGYSMVLDLFWCEDEALYK